MSHKEQVFTKEQIYENVWGYDYPADPNNLTSFIRKLRRRLSRSRTDHAISSLSEVLDISTRKMRKW
ncbi:MAG: winged helix-turn-helix domain-containing protein [Oscillospiraceae bacterium]